MDLGTGKLGTTIQGDHISTGNVTTKERWPLGESWLYSHFINKMNSLTGTLKKVELRFWQLL